MGRDPSMRSGPTPRPMSLPPTSRRRRGQRRGRRGAPPAQSSLRPRSNASLRSLAPRAAGLLPAGVPALLCSLLAAACITASAVGYVWVKAVQVQAGYDIHRLQKEMAELRRERSALDVEVQSLLRPERLARVGKASFGLAPPRADQLIDLGPVTRDRHHPVAPEPPSGGPR